MCGLVSVFGSIGAEEEDAFLQLVELDQKRGRDATGIASVSLHFNKVQTVKAALDATKFLRQKKKDIKRILSGNAQALLGHNRFATMGANTDDNSHPFTFDHITGIHNGVLGYRDLSLLPSKNNHDVDSARLFYSISKSGLEPSIACTSGDWALIWYDSVENKSYFLRNSGRPLWYRYSEDNKTLWVMSDFKMGDEIILHPSSGLKLDEAGWKQFETDQLYSLDATAKTLELVKEKEVLGKPAPTYTYTPRQDNVFLFQPNRSKSYEEWLERRAKNPHKVFGPERATSGVQIEGFPWYSFEELKELTLGQAEELYERIGCKVAQLISNRSLDYIQLAKHNWAELVTWRKAHRDGVVRHIVATDKNIDTINTLSRYRDIINGQISRKKLVIELKQKALKPKAETPAAIITSKSYVELSSNVSARTRNKLTNASTGVINVFTLPSSDELTWINNHSQADNEHITGLYGDDYYLSYDDDLEGRICISWTKNSPMDKEHVDMCRNIHRALDYHVVKWINTWDKNRKRKHLIDDFDNAVEIRNYGMDWKYPPSSWMKHPLSVKTIHKWVRKAVEDTLNGSYIQPFIAAETIYKLKEAA